jgi:hypothetical protein
MIELEEPSQVTMNLLQKFNNALRIEHISVKDKVRMNHFNWTKSTSLFTDLIHKWIDIDRMNGRRNRLKRSYECPVLH